MKHILLFGLLATGTLTAQSVTLPELQARIVRENKKGIADSLRVERAQANLQQARAILNPTFRINEVNFSHNKSAETLPRLYRNGGVHQQIALELEQPIETGGKRKQRVAFQQLQLEQAELDQAQSQHALVLSAQLAWGTLMKTEYILQLCRAQRDQLTPLMAAYERQVEAGRIPQTDYIRLQAAWMNLAQATLELEYEQTEALHELQLLANWPDLQLDQLNLPTPEFNLSQKLMELDPFNSSVNRIYDRQLANAMAQDSIAHRLALAERVPNLAVQLNYDRGGSIMHDFIGVGIALELPLFNRNQGAIRAAVKTKEANRLEQTIEKAQRSKQIERAINQLHQLEVQLLSQNSVFKQPILPFISAYTAQLTQRNISLYEWIDFMQSYRESALSYGEIVQDYYRIYSYLHYQLAQSKHE